MTTKITLNKAVIATLPEGTYQDAKQKGLLLKVTAHSRRWSLYAWINNRPTKKSLGIWPEMDVMEARRAAAALVGGRKPEVQKGVTLEELAAEYTRHLEDQGKRTSGYMDDSLRLNWSAFKLRDITTITVPELAAEHSKILRTRGPQAAKRAILTLRTLYSYAEAMEYCERNPAKKVKVVASKSREVVLTPEEAEVFKVVLAGMLHPTNDIQDYFLIVRGTGLRRSNIAGLEWDWWSPGVITVPAAKSKNGEQMVIPLSTEVEEILIRRQQEATSDRFVFPSSKSASGHLTEPWFWLKEIRSRMAEMGVTKNWTIHDLRRTHGTDLTERGAPITVVAMCLGHRNVKSTPIYSRPSLDSARKWL